MHISHKFEVERMKRKILIRVKVIRFNIEN